MFFIFIFMKIYFLKVLSFIRSVLKALCISSKFVWRQKFITVPIQDYKEHPKLISSFKKPDYLYYFYKKKYDFFLEKNLH